MNAVVHDGSGGVRVDEVADARVQEPTDAVVRVQLAGICGTDLHLLQHHESLPRGFVMGHEFVGTVAETGAQVTGLRSGDLVVGNDYTACGTCHWCRSGDHWHCDQRRFFGTGTTFGPALPGAQAELVRVPFADTTLRRLPDGVDRVAAVLLGDVLATAYAAAIRLAVTPGELAVVLGGGPVGQVACLMLHAFGAAPVAIVEPVEKRRRMAARMGSVALAPDDATSGVRELSRGLMADVVLDAVGGATGLDLAFDLVRARGRIESVGVPPEPKWTMPVGMAFAQEVRLGFSVGNFIRDSEPLLSLLRVGLVDPVRLLSTRDGLRSAPAAYAEMAERHILKNVVDLTQASGG